jgi:hypothetical protein
MFSPPKDIFHSKLNEILTAKRIKVGDTEWRKKLVALGVEFKETPPRRNYSGCFKDRVNIDDILLITNQNPNYICVFVEQQIENVDDENGNFSYCTSRFVLIPSDIALKIYTLSDFP